MSYDFMNICALVHLQSSSPVRPRLFVVGMPAIQSRPYLAIKTLADIWISSLSLGLLCMTTSEPSTAPLQAEVSEVVALV
jgi:hypothetical protein